MAKLNNADTNDNCSVYISEVQQIAAQKDEKIKELYERLVIDTAELEGKISLSAKQTIIIGVEFLIARLRFLISEELRFLEYQQNFPDDSNKYLQTFFSKRKSYLSALYGRINDIRGDLELIEKTFYYNRFNNL